jgi:hypothetical protein
MAEVQYYLEGALLPNATGANSLTLSQSGEHGALALHPGFCRQHLPDYTEELGVLCSRSAHMMDSAIFCWHKLSLSQSSNHRLCLNCISHPQLSN